MSETPESESSFSENIAIFTDRIELNKNIGTAKFCPARYICINISIPNESTFPLMPQCLSNLLFYDPLINMEMSFAKLNSISYKLRANRKSMLVFPERLLTPRFPFVFSFCFLFLLYHEYSFFEFLERENMLNALALN